MTPDDKYSRRNMQIIDNNFKRVYLKKERLFVDFRLYFWNVHEMYNVLKNKKSILV